MYCPRCGIENLNEAYFCRACGADISLVPQALTGNLPVERDDANEVVERSGSRVRRRKEKGKKEVNIEDAMETFFVGLAFLLLVLGGAIFFRGGFMIWVWFIIPAFACIGGGVGKYIRYKQESALKLPRAEPAALPPSSSRAERVNSGSAEHYLPVRDTAEIISSFETVPASVTEGTTRLLDKTTERPSAATAPTKRTKKNG